MLLQRPGISNPSLLRSAPPDQVLDYLYCGSIYNASNKKQIQELQIDYVLNLRNKPIRYPNPPSDFKVLHCPLDDYGTTDLIPYWSTCFDFISEAKSKKKKVRVHCDGGISRAPTIIAGYLVSREHWTLLKAFEHLKKVRPCIAPRETYIKQLRQLEKSTLGEDSLGFCVEGSAPVKSFEEQRAQTMALLAQYMRVEELL